jgi:hypothetical protein
MQPFTHTCVVIACANHPSFLILYKYCMLAAKEGEVGFSASKLSSDYISVPGQLQERTLNNKKHQLLLLIPAQPSAMSSRLRPS